MNRRAVGALLLSLTLLGGCATGPSGADIAGSCTAAAADTTSPADCEAVVRHLDKNLVAWLDGALPASAKLHNFMYSLDNKPLGGDGVRFNRLRTEDDGQFGYEADVRIEWDGHIDDLSVVVDTYSSVPSNRVCPDADRVDDMTAKGIQSGPCGRQVEPDGTVVDVVQDARPFGSGKYADILRPSVFMTAYRADGTRVVVTDEAVILHEPGPESHGLQPLSLTSQQLHDLAVAPELVPA
jgi:hypothetical protein